GRVRRGGGRAPARRHGDRDGAAGDAAAGGGVGERDRAPGLRGRDDADRGAHRAGAVGGVDRDARRGRGVGQRAVGGRLLLILPRLLAGRGGRGGAGAAAAGVAVGDRDGVPGGEGERRNGDRAARDPQFPSPRGAELGRVRGGGGRAPAGREG